MTQGSPFLHQSHCSCQIAACLDTALSLTNICVSLLPLSNTMLLSAYNCALIHLKCYCSLGMQSTLQARNDVRDQLSQLQQVKLVPTSAESVLPLQKGLSFWFATDENSSSLDTLIECNCSPRQIVLLLGSAFVCKALLLAQHVHSRRLKALQCIIMQS